MRTIHGVNTGGDAGEPRTFAPAAALVTALFERSVCSTAKGLVREHRFEVEN